MDFPRARWMLTNAPPYNFRETKRGEKTTKRTSGVILGLPPRRQLRRFMQFLRSLQPGHALSTFQLQSILELW